MPKKFLTAMLDGHALYEGDRVYSAYHDDKGTVKGMWLDETDGEVFIHLQLDNSTLGTGNASIKSLVRLEKGD